MLVKVIGGVEERLVKALPWLVRVFGGVEERLVVSGKLWLSHLGALTADAAGQLHVLGHDSDPLRVDRAEVGVLEEANQVCFRSLLQRHNSGGLEAEIALEVTRNLADEALERSLLEEKVRGLLVAADLAQGDGARAVAVLLGATLGRGRLASRLGSQLLAGRLATGGFASRLLRASHVDQRIKECSGFEFISKID